MSSEGEFGFTSKGRDAEQGLDELRGVVGSVRNNLGVSPSRNLLETPEATLRCSALGKVLAARRTS